MSKPISKWVRKFTCASGTQIYAEVNPKVNQKAFQLYQAVEKCDLKRIRHLVGEKGARGDRIIVEGRSALSAACRDNKLDVVQLLIQLRTPMDRDDYHINTHPMSTPLSEAVTYGNTEVAKALIKAGAKLSVYVQSREVLLLQEPLTYLHLACTRDNREMVTILVESGADLEAETKLKNTPLHLAARFGRNQHIEFLADKGAQLDAQNVAGDAPVHVAVRCRKLGAVRALVGCYCSLEVKNNEKLTALDMASKLYHTEIAAYLREHRRKQSQRQNSHNVISSIQREVQELQRQNSLLRTASTHYHPLNQMNNRGRSRDGASHAQRIRSQSADPLDVIHDEEGTGLAQVLSTDLDTGLSTGGYEHLSRYMSNPQMVFAGATGEVEQGSYSESTPARRGSTASAPYVTPPPSDTYHRRRLDATRDSGCDSPYISMEDVRLRCVEMRSLKTNENTLRTCLNLTLSAKKLVEYGVISPTESDVIAAEYLNDYQKNTYVIQTLLRTVQCAKYYAFLRVLDETGQSFLAHALRVTQARIQNHGTTSSSSPNVFTGVSVGDGRFCHYDLGNI